MRLFIEMDSNEYENYKKLKENANKKEDLEILLSKLLESIKEERGLVTSDIVNDATALRKNKVINGHLRRGNLEITIDIKSYGVDLNGIQ